MSVYNSNILHHSLTGNDLTCTLPNIILCRLIEMKVLSSMHVSCQVLENRLQDLHSDNVKWWNWCEIYHCCEAYECLQMNGVIIHEQHCSSLYAVLHYLLQEQLKLFIQLLFGQSVRHSNTVHSISQWEHRQLAERQEEMTPRVENIFKQMSSYHIKTAYGQEKCYHRGYYSLVSYSTHS